MRGWRDPIDRQPGVRTKRLRPGQVAHGFPQRRSGSRGFSTSQCMQPQGLARGGRWDAKEASTARGEPGRHPAGPSRPGTQAHG